MADKEITVKAQLDDAISTGLKKIDDSLLTVSKTAKVASGETSSALSDVEKAAKKEADTVSKDVVNAHEKAGEAADKHSSKLKGMKESVLSTLDSFGGFVTGGLVIAGASQAFDFLGESISKAMEHGREAEQTQASLNASLQMTSKVTGVTSTMANQLADSLSGVTTFSADTILSGESVMAIFQNISKKTFPEATKVALDLAAKLGVDVPTASRLLGRALNDPLKGVSQLTRYGITLTATQQEQVKQFMKTNNVAAAQGIILNALHSRLGDVAQAMGDTLTGRIQIFNNKMELLQEKVGEAVIPILTKLLGVFLPLVSWLADKIPQAVETLTEIFNKDFAPTLNQVASTLAILGQSIGNALVPFFQNLVATGSGVVQFFKQAGPPAQALEAVFGMLAGGLTAVAAKTVIFAAISKAQMIPTLIEQATQWWGVAAGVIAATWPILAIGAAVTAVVLLFKHWYDTNEGFRNAVNLLVSTALNNLQAIMVAIQPIVQQVEQAWSKFSATLSAKVQPIIAALAAFIVAALPKIQKAFSALITWLTPIWQGLWPIIQAIVAVTMNNVIGDLSVALNIVIGVIKVATDLLQGNWSGAWNDIKDTAHTIWTIIQSTMSSDLQIVVSTIKQVFGGIPVFFASVWNAISSTVGGVFSRLGSDIRNDLTLIWNTVSSGLTNVRNAFSNAWNAIVTATKNLWSGIQTLVGNIVSGLQTAWNTALMTAKNVWNNIVTAIVNAFTTAYNHSYLFQYIVDTIVSGWNTIKTTTQNVWNGITSFLSSAWSKIQSGASAVWNAITSVLSFLWNAELNGLKIIWNTIVSFLMTVWNGIKNTAAAVWNAISSFFTFLWNAELNGIRTIWNVIFSFLSNTWNLIKNTASVIWNAIWGVLSVWLNNMKLIVQGVWNSVSGYLSGVWNTIKNTAANIWGGISGAITNTVRTLFNNIGSIMNGLHGAAINWATGMRDGLVSGITGAWNAVRSALGGIVNNIVAFVKGALGIHSPSTVFMGIGQNMLLGMIHGFKGGDLAGHIGGFINNSLGGLGNVIKGVVNKGLVSLNGLGSMGQAVLNKLGLGSLIPSIGSAIGGVINAIKFTGSGSIQSWIRQALSLTGEPLSWLGPLSLIAQHESGGNPNAINLWDINAKHGDPSKGLMQVISTTFAGNMLPGHNNIWNPVDNAAAAIRYIARRYGSVFNVPGVVSMMHGGPYVGYAEGGVINEPIVGVGLRSGTQYAFGERGSEAVVPLGGRSGGGSAAGQIVIQNHIYFDGREVSNQVGARIVQRVRTVTQRKV